MVGSESGHDATKLHKQGSIVKLIADTTRRAILIIACSLMTLPFQASAASAAIAVIKDPNCGCCNGWVDHLRQAGFSVVVTAAQDLLPVKSKIGIPSQLTACHTTEVAGYVLEGRVPAPAITRLLRERPNGRGLAVPRMPIGSPGMEVEGSAPSIFEVILYGGFRATVIRTIPQGN